MSKATRRISVARSASGCMRSPRFASLGTTNWSIGWSRRASLAGTLGFAAGTNAQCGSYFAPSVIQRLRSSTCSSVRRPIFASGGGITLSGSSEVTRAMSSLAATSSGTIAREPLSSSATACSATSSRRPACRLPLSGPWQAKQFSDRIGRMSRLNESFAGPAAGGASAAHATAAASTLAERTAANRGEVCDAIEIKMQRFIVSSPGGATASRWRGSRTPYGVTLPVALYCCRGFRKPNRVSDGGLPEAGRGRTPYGVTLPETVCLTALRVLTTCVRAWCRGARRGPASRRRR